MIKVRNVQRQIFLMVLMVALAACGGTQQAEQSAEEQIARNPDVQQTTVQSSLEASLVPTAGASSASASASAEAQPSTNAQASTTVTTTSETQTAQQPFDPARVRIGLEEMATGLRNPLFVTHSADGNLFVVEKGGRVVVFQGGDFQTQPQVFMDIGARVGARGSEQGLLGLAMHPRFAENGYVYVNYTDRDGHTVVSRFNVGLDALAIDPDSEQIIMRQEQPASNHNGGMLAFGPDGYLYIGLGDGGGAGDTFGNGQNRQTWLGKLLRIDVDSAEPYAVPSDNPFVGDSSFKPEIWAYGLRNPWRFSFDRETNELFIGDVGQNRYEFIHYQPAGSEGGQNFGWPIIEGIQCFRDNNCDRTGLTQAIVDYPHELGCSVTGGYVYRGQRYPELRGVYIFGDYCSGRIWTLTRGQDGAWQLNEALQSGQQISSFGEDAAGEMYVTDLASGQLLRLTAETQ